jgi:hypothetical protein
MSMLVIKPLTLVCPPACQHHVCGLHVIACKAPCAHCLRIPERTWSGRWSGLPAQGSGVWGAQGRTGPPAPEGARAQWWLQD